MCNSIPARCAQYHYLIPSGTKCWFWCTSENRRNMPYNNCVIPFTLGVLYITIEYLWKLVTALLCHLKQASLISARYAVLCCIYTYICILHIVLLITILHMYRDYWSSVKYPPVPVIGVITPIRCKSNEDSREGLH